MSKPEVRIGAGDWWGDNPNRIGIYNANYCGNFDKWRNAKKPWTIAAPNNCDALGKQFETYEAAAIYIREEVLAK